MSDSVFRHKLARDVNGPAGLHLHYLDANGEVAEHDFSERPPMDDEFIDVGEVRVPWDRVFALTGHGNDRHVSFLDELPPEAAAPLHELAEHSETLAALTRAALRSWPLESDHLRPICGDLTDEDRKRAIESAFGVLERSDGLSRGMLLALGILGGPAEALRLGDAIVELYSLEEEAAWRWRYGLEALRLIGTRAAHMQIQRVAMESPTPSAISAARDKLQHIAGDLNVPVWEVQDELVPNCGLNDDGSVNLDYGPRQFMLRFDDALRPVLVENPGRQRHYDLPDPTADDDASLAAETQARWAIVREQLIEAVPVQVHRFEEALAQQQRWDGKQWDRMVRRHPLLRYLVTRAIWGSYSPGGRKLVDTFRVSQDDGTLWGPDDEPYELNLDNPVGLPHPSEIRDPIRAEWGEVMADYEVVTMFPQIGRPVFRPSEDVRKATNYALDFKVPYHEGMVQLHRHGWTVAQHWHLYLQKIFRTRDVKAVCQITIDESGADKMLHIHSISWERYLGYPKSNFQLRDVHEVPYTEALYEMEQLRMPQETGGWAAVVAPNV